MHGPQIALNFNSVLSALKVSKKVQKGFRKLCHVFMLVTNLSVCLPIHPTLIIQSIFTSIGLKCLTLQLKLH